jgi:hypothetical protein
MSKKKWNKELLAAAEEFGFVLLRENRHMFWAHPSGATVTTASTPSDNYALAQCRRQFRRSANLTPA